MILAQMLRDGVRKFEVMMTFPTTSREVYSQNFIKEAICQVRFPRLLEIESQVPVRFQKLLFEEFPYLDAREQFGVMIGSGPEGPFATPSRSTIYEFKNSARDTTISVCSEFVAVITTSYNDWATHRSWLQKALQAASECYGISMYSRLGLRYINSIPLSTSLDGIVDPCLLGPLATDQRDRVAAFNSTSTFFLGDDRQLNLVSSLAGPDGAREYLLDFDIFQESAGRFDTAKLVVTFDELNGLVTDAFNWAQGPKLNEMLKRNPGTS
ncbi:TIGR04255 family protein [Phenylobacterium sp. 58.2.17]|uniref:TIGR04255 family protein n=1 Tax=Phenylobacterium sp. 58.2.17 TaxID=2969306 RepID=UPI00226416EE|nr:TIGR04255 family protein [Phenylobacterium sp. 58.2.17]MCX7587115.1 TIGR04255 family protein [Phenylobacterium sp. 58.2.17]